MATIVCPHCHQSFELESSDYQDIVSQVRTSEFERELHERHQLMEGQKASELAEERAKSQLELQRLQSELNQELAQLRERLAASDDARASAVREARLSVEQERVKVERERDELAARLSKSEDATKLAQERTRSELQAQQAELQAEVARLKAELQAQQAQAARERQLADAQAKSELQAERSRLELELSRAKDSLESQAQSARQAEELAVQRATSELRTQCVALEGQLAQRDSQRNELEARYREKLNEAQKSQEEIVRIKDDEIERLKDYRLRLTVKMTGESLEQHCQQEFNRWRSQDPSSFKNIYFEKDNEAVEGTKGDFVYRETDDEGNELLSIMFEMKNEELGSTNKKTNESHLAKLDRDRQKKGCEYAVLVSMLELDSDYYNQGIVDMSYRYPKMYVVRPQFFLLIIALLRNAAQKSQDLRLQIAQMRSEQIDITNFEDALGDFQDKFGRNVELANKKFNTAVEEIDKTITHLQKVKENLLGSQNNLRLADEKANKLTIKRLTKNSPMLAERFRELDDNKG
ncbi:DUF2130 domain-containing protein [Olsenella phocaeensis]|uniref:DUF2130 domain-containing protein n=1 Tax=Olsenella phocaeensis TaxID=1852385 RepID=UPI003A92F8BF